MYFSVQGMPGYAQFCISKDLDVAISDPVPGKPTNGLQITKGTFTKNIGKQNNSTKINYYM